MRRKRRILLLLAVAVATVLAGCSTGAPPGPAESPVIIPKTTKVLSDTTRNSLQSYDPTTGELRFGPQADFGTLKPDDVLVTQPLPPLAPYGFLRKVVSVSTAGQDTVVQTVPAKLTEAIQQGAFQIDQPLKPSMLASSVMYVPGVALESGASADTFAIGVHDVVLYDADGNHSTTGDQVRASGSFSLAPVLQVGGGLHFHFCCSVESRFKFAIGLNQSVHVSVTADAGVHVSKEVPLGSMTFTPITIWVGPVPLVFVPKLAIVANFDGSVSAKLTFSASEDLTLLAGTEKPYGHGFHDISTSHLGGSAHADNLLYHYPAVTFGMKAAVGARFQILLYDLIGPQAKLDAYVRITGQMPGNPVWKAYAGLEGSLGLHVAVLDLNWDKKIFDASVSIGQQTGNIPPLLDPSDINPADGSSAQLGVPVQFGVLGRDAEDGSIFKGTWTSDVDGPLSLDGNNRHTFTTSGLRRITATVKDSAGAKASATIRLTVLDTPPVATLSSPNPNQGIYTGQPALLLLGSAVDANEPGGALACTRLTWHSSDANDVLPADGCPDTSVQAASFSSALGTHTITLTATDPQGMSDSESVTVNVLAPPANYPPTGVISKPTKGQTFGDLQPVDLAATLFDPDDDTLTYTWYIDLGSGNAFAQNGTVTGASTKNGTTPVGATISTVVPGLGCTGTQVPYTVGLIVNDSHTIITSTRSILCNVVPR